MAKLPSFKPKEIIRVLERNGFDFIRQKGSHRIYKKDNIKITIPYHGKDLRKSTLFAIIKESGLNIEKFLK